MTNENTPDVSTTQETHSTQPQQSTPDNLSQNSQQAAETGIRQIAPQLVPGQTIQGIKSLMDTPLAGLVAVPNTKDDFCLLTANGPKTLSTCIDEAYNGPLVHLYTWDEIGISRLYADTFSYILRYVTERKKWYMFNGKFWESADGREMELCKLLVKEVYEYNLKFLPFLDKKQQGFMKNLTARHVRENILKDASSVAPIKMSDFDKDPMLFNCENGTLDLRTGTLRPHNPDDLITKIADVTYDPNARCARWEQHIQEVMDGDTEKAEYLQKAFGLCLTGENPYECFFILYGPTSRNGKSTTMETIMIMMKDYGKAARPDTITRRQTPNGNGPSEDIARLAGARIVNISEPDKKLVLDSALVKTLSGNDTISARNLHENSFEFIPTFKFLINTNHLPQIPDPTVFTSGRVKVIPFTHHFDDKHQDKNLKKTLIQPQNLSGILNWCMEGLKLLQTQGFDAPASVIEATAQYQQDSDKIARFLEERLTSTPGVNTKLEDVYAEFKAWCENNGLRAEGMPRFKQSLGAHVRIGRSRSVGSTKVSNAVSCILDYSLQAQEHFTYIPMTDEEIQEALAPYGIKFGPSDPNINSRVDAASYGYVAPGSIDNRNF